MEIKCQNTTGYSDEDTGQVNHHIRFRKFTLRFLNASSHASFWLQTLHSSVPYQVTNYGLGGLCEPHIDPHGYIEGTKFNIAKRYLF